MRSTSGFLHYTSYQFPYYSLTLTRLSAQEKGSSTNIIRVRLFKVWRYVGRVYFSYVWLVLGVCKSVMVGEGDRVGQVDSFVEVEVVSV